MGVKAFRVKNFMGFEDSGWIELRPLTLLFGQNSAGKSALLKALRMLKQSLNPALDEGPIILSSGAGVDLGNYQDVVHLHDKNKGIYFEFKCDEMDRELLSYFKSQKEKDDAKRRIWEDDSLSEDEKFERLKNPEKEAVPIDQAWATLEVGYRSSTFSSRRLFLSQVVLRAAWSKTEGQQDSQIFYAEYLGTSFDWWFDSDFLQGHLIDPNKFINDESDNPWRPEDQFLTNQGPFPCLPGVTRSKDKNIWEDYYVVGAILSEFKQKLWEFFGSLNYLGPMRSKPERFYYLPDLAQYVPNIDLSTQPGSGLDVLRSFLSLEGGDQWQARLDEANSALKPFGFKLDTRHPDGHELLFELRLTELADLGTTANLSDMGFGWSQVLPVILTCILAEPNSTVLMEQPELHLHPRAQAILGDLFLQATKRNVRFLIETHSEHLVLRLQKRIRQLKAKSDDLAVVYVTRKKGESKCHALRINHEGDFLDSWPEGFFEERFDELFGPEENDTTIIG